MEWKLKGSAGTFNSLEAKIKYKTAQDVRNQIKAAMGLSEESVLDIVLYRNSNPNKVVSDLERVSVPEKFLVSRMSSTEAKKLLEEAATNYSGEDNSPPSSPPHEDPTLGVIDDVNTNQTNVNSTVGNSNVFVNDEEDSKIASAMAAGGIDIPDTLQRRYYRNKTLQDPIKSQQNPNQFQNEDKNAYICHMCGNPGHNIKDCSIVDGRRCEKKIRSATGIPVNFLRTIRQDEIQNYKEVYILKDGTFAVMKDISTVSGGAYFNISAEDRISDSLGKQVKSQFKCPKCSNLLADPMTTLCCGETFCSNCLFQNKTSAIFPCPGCARRIGARYLEPNVALREALKNSLENDKTIQNAQNKNLRNEEENDSNNKSYKERRIDRHDQGHSNYEYNRHSDKNNEKYSSKERNRDLKNDRRSNNYSRQRVLASEYISHYRKGN